MSSSTIGEEWCNDIDLILQKIRAQLKEKGAKGLHGLRVAFRTVDFNGNNKLDRDEFEECLAHCGIFLKSQELSSVMRYFDIENDGNITYDEFVSGLAPTLTGRRLAIVNKAFDNLDIDGSGVLTYSDISERFMASNHPDVITGKQTTEEVKRGFLMGFEGQRNGDNNGEVSREEFQDYYRDLAGSIHDDNYFVEVLESAWMITEGDSKTVSEMIAGLRLTLTEKIMAKAKTTEAPTKSLQKTFNFFDKDQSGRLTVDEFRNVLEWYGISLERKHTIGLFNHFDHDRSGTILTREFVQTVIPEDEDF